jgi:hypothetical protein
MDTKVQKHRRNGDNGNNVNSRTKQFDRDHTKSVPETPNAQNDNWVHHRLIRVNNKKRKFPVSNGKEMEK